MLHRRGSEEGYKSKFAARAGLLSQLAPGANRHPGAETVLSQEGFEDWQPSACGFLPTGYSINFEVLPAAAFELVATAPESSAGTGR